MKILFIGGTGNISTDCAALLHRRGHEVSILTRGRTMVPPEYRAVQADRKDPAALQAALTTAGPEVVIDFLAYELADVQTAFELLQGRVRQYLFISSATVYSKPPVTLPITEDAPLGNPWWEYAQKKLACEEWLLARWHEKQFPVTVVRPSHTYSQIWIPNPVASSNHAFALRIEQGRPVFVPDSGENPWTMTASSDFAVGLAGLIGKPETAGEAFHITSDEVLTWNQIYEVIAGALGVKSPRVEKIPTDFICKIEPSLTGNLKGDKSHPGVFDNSRLKRFVPEFKCTKSFQDGMRESAEWMRRNREKLNPGEPTDGLIEHVLTAWKEGQPGAGKRQ